MDSFNLSPQRPPQPQYSTDRPSLDEELERSTAVRQFTPEPLRKEEPKSTQTSSSEPTSDATKKPKSTKAKKPKSTTEASVRKTRWFFTTLPLFLLGGAMLWAAFPPLSIWPLAWVAPALWIYLIRPRRMPGWRPYLMITIVAFGFWMALFQGIRLAHWGTALGWPFLSAYLALYPLFFIWISRVAVHRLRVPLIFAAPIVWVGLELLRGHALTGFSMALLAHTQAGMPILIQVSDLAGGYTLSFAIIAVAACFARVVPCGEKRWAWWPALPIVAIVGATAGYGHFRLNETLPEDNRSAKVALIQGSIDTVFDGVDRSEGTFSQYLQITDDATAEHTDLDWVVWPESMFAYPMLESADDPQVPAGMNKAPDDVKKHCLDSQRFFAQRAEDVVRGAQRTRNVPALVGASVASFGEDEFRHYNTAFWMGYDERDRHVEVLRYDKMHPVMFGEYIPLGDVFPVLYDLTPLSTGLSIGDRPAAFYAGDLRFAPSICFENTVPHLIRRQIAQLSEHDLPPDALVTITNDGWFKGSTILDFHAFCGVFRAVENRKPMLIAANTGISAVIDGNGHVQQAGPRRETTYLVAEVRPDGRQSLYTTIGDWPAVGCLALTGIVALIGFGAWFFEKPNAPAEESPKKTS